MKNFRTYQLAITLHKECRKLRIEDYLKKQLLRSASSVALNLSEGRGKRTLKDQRKYFDIAFGSLRETQTALELAEAPREIVQLADQVAAHLYLLLKRMGLP